MCLCLAGTVCLWLVGKAYAMLRARVDGVARNRDLPGAYLTALRSAGGPS
ncbi:hypothetical protein SALBM311S_12597 [Streptomyces alboniger]